MSQEIEELNISAQFEQLIETEDKLAIREFLDDQNIADVAELINAYPDYEAQIIANMAINRASSVFKILDIAQQKDIIKALPTSKTAELLNDLPADDRTDFLEELPKAVIRDLIKLLEPEERKITLSDVYRNANMDIVSSGGTLDGKTRLITVSVSWSTGGTTTTKSIST